MNNSYNYFCGDFGGNMKKNTIIILLVILIGIASVLGILLYNKEHKIIENGKEVKELVKEVATFEELKKKIGESDLEITSEIEATGADLLGASEGKVYTIGDSHIRVYKYDLNQSSELTVKNLKLAQEDGKVVIQSLDDLEIKVIYNKGLILIDDEEFENREKIVEVFKSL